MVVNNDYQSFTHGVFVGIMKEHISAQKWKKIKPQLLLSFGKFTYFCSVEDAKEQLTNLLLTCEFIEPNDCNASIWKGGTISAEKQKLMDSCTFINKEKAKSLGRNVDYWMNNPKYHWEWNGVEKYGRKAYDFEYMICRGTTMGEFYGGGTSDID